LKHAWASRKPSLPDRKRTIELILQSRPGARDVSNPFDNQGGAFVVLINDQGQHSLWPAAAGIPVGWSIACEQTSRQACIEYIDKNWTDMRPRTGVNIQRP
jgi:MbtH protein